MRSWEREEYERTQRRLWLPLLVLEVLTIFGLGALWCLGVF